MPDWLDKAKNLASEHPDLAEKGLDEAAKLAKDKTGGRFDGQIDQAEQHAAGFLGIADQDENQ